MATNVGEVPEPSRKAKCLGGSTVYLQDVVKILVTDSEFIKNWRRFYYSLQQPSTKFIHWDTLFKNGTIRIDDILIEMLSEWVMALGSEANVRRLHEYLISENFVFVAEALTNQYGLSCKIVNMTSTASNNQSGTTNSEDDTPISFDLCEPTDNFVGRKTELEMLDTFYQQKAKLVVVSGLGGVGKSELVRKFGITFLKDVRGNCIWIQGDSEESFKNSIKRLAVSLKLELDSDVVEGFVKVYNSKLKHRPILIIVDNVDKSNSLVVKLIKGCKPLLNNVPLIIVTTRNKSVLQIEGRNIELKMLEQGEAVQMVTNGLESRISLSEATKLCDTLDHFPLIVQQAISFIKQKRCDPFEQNFSVLEYLELFDKQKEKLMDSALSIDDNYNSTTFATWRMILDNIKQMNGRTGLLAVNILQTLPYFNANGVNLSQLVWFYEDDNMPHKTCIGSQSDQSRLDSEEIKEAIRLIEAYSMCRVDWDVWGYNISSHRLIRDFMLLCRDTEMDKEIIRRLFFFFDYIWFLDHDNVDKLAQTNKTLVVELFTKCWNLDVDDEQSCPSDLEIYKKKFYEALETHGLNIHLALKSKYDILVHSRTMLEDFHTINHYVRRRYGLDHLLTRSLREEVGRCFNLYEIPIQISIGFLVDVMDDGLTDTQVFQSWFRSIMESLLTGRVPIDMTDLIIELKESVINFYDFNEYYDQQFTFSMLTAISQFFKRNEDIGRFNEIQSEMSCLMQHPSELITIWHSIKHRLGYPSSVQNFISNNYNHIVDDCTLSYLLNRLYSRESRSTMETMDNLFYESKAICYLDLFAIANIAMGWDKDMPSDILTKLDSDLINKDLILRVIQTIDSPTEELTYTEDILLVLHTEITDSVRNEDDLLSMYTEITESVRNGLVNSYEGIWSLGQICKVLWTKFRNSVEIELIDALEGLANTEKDMELVKTILYSIVNRAVLDEVHRIHWDYNFADIGYWNGVIPLFLRLQKYGLYFPILKQILQLAPVEEIMTIGSNIIDNQRKGLINKPDTFFAIKQVVKSFLKKQEKEKTREILCQSLDIENLIPSNGNQNKLLFEKVQSTVVHLDDINIAIAAYFYYGSCMNLNDPRESENPYIILRQILDIVFKGRCMELDDPRESGHPCILLLQILKILCKEENPTKLLALCYEIYHFGEGSSTLKCWALIQTLKLIAEMNRNDLAERFLRKIIRKNTLNDWLWYYKACWFLVFGTYYKPGLDPESTSDTLEVENYVKILKSFDALIKDECSLVID